MASIAHFMGLARSGGRQGLVTVAKHHGTRKVAEGIGTGLVLGGLHATLKTGLDVGKVPIDGVGGALLAFVGGEVGGEIGASMLSVFSFRKFYDLVAEKRLASGQEPGGTFGPAQKTKVAGELSSWAGDNSSSDEDPILAAAQAL